jgi:hypothetical protein
VDKHLREDVRAVSDTWILEGQPDQASLTTQVRMKLAREGDT